MSTCLWDAMQCLLREMGRAAGRHAVRGWRQWRHLSREVRSLFHRVRSKTGTIFEDSPLGLDKWLPAVWLIVNTKNGVSSYEIGRTIGVTQKTAWFMGHRIRLALHEGSFEKLAGEVEVDETFIGGKARNIRVAERKRRIHGRGPTDKTIVLEMPERARRRGRYVTPDEEGAPAGDQGSREGRLDPLLR